nr:hypothetical protein [Tanacetum cinerariifolium]
RWLSNISLKYKFWAVNAVAFITTLLLVLYALQIEQRARADDAEAFHQARQQLLAAWPGGQAAPSLPPLAAPPSFDQLLAEHAGHYAIAVFSETDQVATAINEMTATVYHIAQHASATRDQSQHADTLAGSGKEVVDRVQASISGLSNGVQQTASMIQRLAED